jgi:hypothetical protein
LISQALPEKGREGEACFFFGYRTCGKRSHR